MADGREVSEIVSTFLLDTCQRHFSGDILHSFAAFHIAAGTAKRQSDDVEFSLIPLKTGSVAELYISPMYRCVGDVDIMLYDNRTLAIPAGYRPPLQLPADFHSRVTVFDIIDSKYLGYVYLLKSYLMAEDLKDGRYNAAYFPPIHLLININRSNTLSAETHGPADVMKASIQSHRDVERLAGSTYSTDHVRCVRCLSWPPQAADWPTRDRKYDGPNSATVFSVISNGCDVVQVAHRLCRQDEWESKAQWRLSFSRAEVVLLNSWTPQQQVVYHMLRVFIKIDELTDNTDETGAQIVSNYHVKTLMLWACELKPTSWWLNDVNVVRICVELLLTLAVWLDESRCPQFFISNCNLFDHAHNAYFAQLIAARLLSITESSLADWFVDNYVRRCARQCPGFISQLFDDIRSCTGLKLAVSALADWRLKLSMPLEIRFAFVFAPRFISHAMHIAVPTLRTCICGMRELADIDQRLVVYFTADMFLQVAYKTATRATLNDELLDVLAATCLRANDARRCFQARHSSMLSLSQAAKLMKVVANKSRTTMQLIEIELSKAYLQRALRCKDSDNDFIYCLANVYLAVLCYSTGHYQTAIYHCTLVTRSYLQDHLQFSSRVVQGELLPKIDDSIDNVLGLAAFYHYVRVTALYCQPQRHTSVFSTELFASYLHIKCLSVTECRQFTATTLSAYELPRLYQYCFYDQRRMCTADVLLCRTTNSHVRRRAVQDSRNPMFASHPTHPVTPCHLDTSQLVELLQQSAVEHLTAFRQLEARVLGSTWPWPVATTDFEALYAYKRGDYQRCLELSTHIVRSLIGRDAVSCVYAFPVFIQWMDDDIVSVTGLVLLAQLSRIYLSFAGTISQLSLTLYLMTQCQMKLHHSVTSLAQTVRYIQVARRRTLSEELTLDRLTLKVTERKILMWFKQLFS